MNVLFDLEITWMICQMMVCQQRTGCSVPVRIVTSGCMKIVCVGIAITI